MSSGSLDTPPHLSLLHSYLTKKFRRRRKGARGLWTLVAARLLFEILLHELIQGYAGGEHPEHFRNYSQLFLACFFLFKLKWTTVVYLYILSTKAVTRVVPYLYLFKGYYPSEGFCTLLLHSFLMFFNILKGIILYCFLFLCNVIFSFIISNSRNTYTPTLSCNFSIYTVSTICNHKLIIEYLITHLNHISEVT